MVGQATVDLPNGTSVVTVDRGFVWLPEDVYGGYPFEHLVPLEHPPSAPLLSTSEARDVNDRGDIVGVADIGVDDIPNAFLFLLSPAYGVQAGAMESLGVLIAGPYASEAWALTEPYLVSDGQGGFIERITVVGRSADDEYNGTFEGNHFESGFAWSSGGSGALTRLDPVNAAPFGGISLRNSAAFGINPVRTTTLLRAVGHSTPGPDQKLCPEYEVREAPVYWNGGSSTPSILNPDEFRSDPPLPDGFIATVFDVNDQDQFVGFLGGNESACKRKAYLWDGLAPVLLADPAGTLDPQTEARGINADGTIVGRDLSTELAVRWTSSAASYLDDLVDLSGIPLSAIRTADAINDSGWIAATAVLAGGGPVLEEGVVLIPTWECPEDINRDGIVDRDDIAALQAATAAGGCVPRIICRADVNADNVIDNADKAAILAALGTTCAQTGTMISESTAALWLSMGGDAYLDTGGDSAAAAIEGAYTDEEAETFVNLVTLLWE